MPKFIITDAVFERLKEPNPELPWIIQVTLKGEGFVPRAAPLVGSVGDIPLEALSMSGDGTARAFLREAPPVGATIRLRWLDDNTLTDTDAKFTGI